MRGSLTVIPLLMPSPGGKLTWRGQNPGNLPSAETNWPTADEPPPLFSTNVTSETMILSSKTEPQPIQTASPRAWSMSMSVPPQFLHWRELMLTRFRPQHSRSLFAKLDNGVKWCEYTLPAGLSTLYSRMSTGYLSLTQVTTLTTFNITM